jgi:hypothetical protein
MHGMIAMATILALRAVSHARHAEGALLVGLAPAPAVVRKSA